MEADPFKQFEIWFKEAQDSESSVEPNSMVVTSCSLDNTPSTRYVLLKEVNQGGFVFYTNYNSRKGQELEANPNVAALFYWPTTNRSVRIEGKAAKIAPEESDAYFNVRPLKSRISSSLSCQSQKITEEEKQRMVILIFLFGNSEFF